MADRNTLRTGEIISFGRGRGQKTLAKIVRVNSTTCTVRTTEARGKHPAGTEWRVPFSLITKTDGAAAPTTAPANTIGVGSRVQFRNGTETVVGTVKRVNTKTYSIEPDGDTSGRYWRVGKWAVKLTDVSAPKVDEAAIKAAEARKAAKAERDFKRWAETYGLKPEWFGQTFTSRGTDYRIVGINTRAPKFPVQVERVHDGRSFKFTAAGVSIGMTR